MKKLVTWLSCTYWGIISFGVLALLSSIHHTPVTATTIMIHGKAVSAGCLAMGDQTAEDLFALTAWVGREQVKVVIAPNQHIQGELLAMNDE